MQAFFCWKRLGKQGFQDLATLTFPHVFTKKCGFQAQKRGLAQNFTPTISEKNPGTYGPGPFNPRQTIAHQFQSQEPDLGVVYVT